MTLRTAPSNPAARRRHSGGYTLIEILTTMVILAIVLPVAMKGISMALALGSNARKRSDAATLAHSKLEELVATNTWQTGQLQGDFSDAGFPDYHWSAVMNTWNDTTLLEVDLTVTWTSRAQQRSMVLTTLLDPGTVNPGATGTPTP